MPATSTLGLSSKKRTLDTEALSSRRSTGSEGRSGSAGKPETEASRPERRLTSQMCRQVSLRTLSRATASLPAVLKATAWQVREILVESSR